MVFNMAVVMLNTAMHPMPAGIDFNDREGIAASIATLPWMASGLIPVADVGQAFFGALISATITPNASMAVASYSLDDCHSTSLGRSAGSTSENARRL